MRKYIRHPSDIPIEYRFDIQTPTRIESLSNVSLGGLSFRSEEPVARGRMIKVRIPLVEPPFEASGRVVWCVPTKDYIYEIGLELLDRDDAYRARMIEQICHIEHYKREVKQTEGRSLSGAQAAQEWIEKFAAEFPEIGEAEAS